MLLLAFLCVATGGTRARADTVASTFSPVIVVALSSGNVTIRTWERQEVQVVGDPTIQYLHAGPMVVARRFQNYQPELWEQTIQTPEGPLSLAPEPFPLPPLSPDVHDAVSVRGEGDVTITVPSATAVIIANVKQGSLSIDGYRGVFVTHVVTGTIHLSNVQGTGAVQVNNGGFYANDSVFDRLRVRTGRGNMFFDNCSSAQIQASSLTGTIVYDNGTFTPGLAHFESQRGSVALGVANGDAQITAHSDAGRVFNEAQEFFRGGPLVTATSGSGAVIYYRGTIRDHPRLMRQLPPNARPFRRPPPDQR
jgi:hypothetical protein